MNVYGFNSTLIEAVFTHYWYLLKKRIKNFMNYEFGWSSSVYVTTAHSEMRKLLLCWTFFNWFNSPSDHVFYMTFYFLQVIYSDLEDYLVEQYYDNFNIRLGLKLISLTFPMKIKKLTLSINPILTAAGQRQLRLDLYEYLR